MPLQLDGDRQLVAGRRGAVQARMPHQHRVVILLRLHGTQRLKVLITFSGTCSCWQLPL